MSAATRSPGRAVSQPATPPSFDETIAPATTPEPVTEPANAPQPAEPAYELVDIDRYEVFDDGPVGYVEVIPPLFICYSGHPYPKAIEVAQVFEFEQAVRQVREAASHAHAPRDHGRSAA